MRAAALAVEGDRVALIERVHENGRLFYEIPGGGVEADESVEGAALRELWEETGLRATIIREIATVWRLGQEQHYYLARADGSTFSTSQGPEHTVPGYMPVPFTPVWIPEADLHHLPIWPLSVARHAAVCFTSRAWPAEPPVFHDDRIALWGPDVVREGESDR